jgi:hypothetical protein
MRCADCGVEAATIEVQDGKRKADLCMPCWYNAGFLDHSPAATLDRLTRQAKTKARDKR